MEQPINIIFAKDWDGPVKPSYGLAGTLPRSSARGALDHNGETVFSGGLSVVVRLISSSPNMDHGPRTKLPTSYLVNLSGSLSQMSSRMKFSWRILPGR